MWVGSGSGSWGGGSQIRFAQEGPGPPPSPRPRGDGPARVRGRGRPSRKLERTVREGRWRCRDSRKKKSGKKEHFTSGGGGGGGGPPFPRSPPRGAAHPRLVVFPLADIWARHFPVGRKSWGMSWGGEGVLIAMSSQFEKFDVTFPACLWKTSQCGVRGPGARIAHPNSRPSHRHAAILRAFRRHGPRRRTPSLSPQSC